MLKGRLGKGSRVACNTLYVFDTDDVARVRREMRASWCCLIHGRVNSPISFTTNPTPAQLPYLKACIDANPVIFEGHIHNSKILEHPPKLVQHFIFLINILVKRQDKLNTHTTFLPALLYLTEPQRSTNISYQKLLPGLSQEKLHKTWTPWPQLWTHLVGTVSCP